MRFPARRFAWLLPLVLTGCFHWRHPAPAQALAPPVVDVPPPAPAPIPTNLPPPVVTIPAPAAAKPAAITPPKPVRKLKVRHKKRIPNSTASNSTTSNNNAEVASSGGPQVSAIGQLTSGDLSGLRQQTVNSIASTERSLNAISGKLDDQEQKTAAQIREFLKQAQAALASGDADGAHTLAIKASVLLGELVR